MSDDQAQKAQCNRIVLCMGEYCRLGNRAKKLHSKLQPMIDELNGDEYPRPIKFTTANCLSMCAAGPNLILYPGNIAQNHLTEDALEDIVTSYLKPPKDDQ